MNKGSNDTTWRLYDSATKKLHDNLTENDVMAMVASLDQNKMLHWFIAEDQDIDWTPLYKCSKKFDMPFSKDQPTEGTSIDMLKINLPERRRDIRPVTKVKVIITAGLRTFETFTSDVSLSTIKLESKFKDKIHGTFDVTLITEDGPLELQCSAIIEPGFQHWNRLKISPDFNFKDYTDFLGRVA